MMTILSIHSISPTPTLLALQRPTERYLLFSQERGSCSIQNLYGRLFPLNDKVFLIYSSHTRIIFIEKSRNLQEYNNWDENNLTFHWLMNGLTVICSLMTSSFEGGPGWGWKKIWHQLFQDLTFHNSPIMGAASAAIVVIVLCLCTNLKFCLIHVITKLRLTI